MWQQFAQTLVGLKKCGKKLADISRIEKIWKKLAQTLVGLKNVENIS